MQAHLCRPKSSFRIDHRKESDGFLVAFLVGVVGISVAHSDSR